MRRARFTEEQIIELLKKAAAGESIREVLQEQGIAKQTFHRWQKTYGDRLGQDDEETRASRSSRTREATEINQLGLQLAEMSQEDLDRLALPEELRDAIDICQSLKIRARVRQKRLVCRILRAEDHEAIRERVEELVRSRPEGPNPRRRR